MRSLILAGALLAAAGTATAASTQAAPAPAPIRVRWLGHAAFEVVSPGGTRVLIDPWLLENPSTPAAYRDTTYWDGPTTVRRRSWPRIPTRITTRTSRSSPG